MYIHLLKGQNTKFSFPRYGMKDSFPRFSELFAVISLLSVLLIGNYLFEIINRTC